MKIKSDTVKLFVLITSLLVIYSYYFVSSYGINCSNDGGHMALASAIYHHQEVSIDKYLGVYASDPDYAVKDGVVFSDRLPGMAFCIIPFLAYADFWSMLIPKYKEKIEHAYPRNGYYVVVATLLSNICGVLSLFCFFLLAYKVFKISFFSSYLSMIIVGLATVMSLESIHLFSHSLSMFLITMAILILLYPSIFLDYRRRIYIISSIIGLASIIELQNSLFLLPLFIYFYMNKSKDYKKREIYQLLLSGIAIFTLFILILLFYNYYTFDEIMIKSNKYNPFFLEEKSFITALSGNFFNGLDNLFTSFNNLKSYFNWSYGIRNDMPGLFVSNPVFLISISGFIMFYKSHRIQSILFISIIIISVLIAAFHVTTLIRHIYTIHLLLFFPFVFILEYIINKRMIFLGLLVLLLSVLSFVRQIYMTSNYWGRDHIGLIFPNLDNFPLFVLLNIPILIILIYIIYKKFYISK